MLQPVEIKKILELREKGETIRTIAVEINKSKTTVTEILKSCEMHGITANQITEEGYGDLLALIYPRQREYVPQKEEPDWEVIHQKLTNRKRVNIKYLWTKYKEEYPDGYEYSQFCYRYSKWRGVNKEVSMVQEHIPGMRACVDWAGLAPKIVNVNGKAVKANFFVGVLSYSQYPFVRAFPDQKQRSWSLAHIKMFSWFRGVPRIVTPDNCKTAVTYASIWAPEINKAYKELGDHYGVGIIPARVRHPKDKSPVEGMVGFIETWIIEAVTDLALKGGLFESFDELNLEVDILLDKLIKENFQERPGSRESIYNEVEKQELLPLPKEPFDNLSYLSWRVNNSYHYYHKESETCYSVPYILYKQTVTIRAGLRTLSIFDKNGVLVVRHIINHDRNIRYCTIPEHMPTNHYEQRKINSMSGEGYRVLAYKAGGPNTMEFVDLLLKRVKYEQTMYKSCQAVINMAKSVGKERIELACKKLMDLDSVSYSSLKSLLDRNLENICTNIVSMSTPRHENLRDPSIYV